MAFKKDKFIDVLVGLAVLTIFVAGLVLATGCLMVFFGGSFLGVVQMNIWVAVGAWVVAGIHICWLGIFDPHTCEIERPRNVFELVWWVALWPLVMVFQLFELLAG